MFNIHLYWYSLNRLDGKDNYGDLLGPFIVSNLTRRKLSRVKSVSAERYKYFIKPYFTIGSIIKRINKNSIVWGSGIITKNEHVEPAKFLAVRGPLTRNRLMELGYIVPEKYGDPAILLPRFISDAEEKKYEIGIIPHYVDYNDVKYLFKNNSKVKVIDLITDDVIRTTKEILECKTIISSSLHGLIVPHTYGIPALWVKFSNKLAGDNIKFFDYFESVGIKYDKQIFCNSSLINYNNILNLIDQNHNKLLPNTQLLNLRKRELFDTNPFSNRK